MPLDYPYPIIERSLYDRTVSLLGCRHMKEFFEEHKAFLVPAIRRADALVLEQSLIPFWGDEFFGRLARVAHEFRRPIYTVDPFTEQMMDTDYYGGCSAALLALASGANIVSTAVKKTRRRFLRDVLLCAGGLSLAAGSIGGVAVRGDLDTEAPHEYGIDDILTYGATDFRNIKIAESLDRICRDVPGFTSLLSIHGAAHYETVDAYLIAPELRLKAALYPLYAEIGDTRIREYLPTREGWELAGTF